MASTLSQSSFFMRSARPSLVMPALFTRIAIGPKSLAVLAKASLMDSALARSMVTANASRPCDANLAGQFLQLSDVARRQRHARARLRQRQSTRPSDAPARAGDESGSICHESEFPS